MAGHGETPSAEHHVRDSATWDFFSRLTTEPVEIHLPKIFGLQITKFMVLELISAGLILLIYLPIARRARTGELPRGAWWNAFESLLTFIRNEVARPVLGEHHTDRFVPFLWTLFLFILFNNLLGLLPFFGSPTASIWVTGGLAVCAFAMLHGPAMYDKGPLAYFQSLWPHIEVAYAGPIFSGMIFLIELVGTVIKSGVLAVRLFANMFAGHMVLAMILLFIVTVGNSAIATAGGPTLLWGGVTFFSVVGVVALSLLELFVAFLQAYIFVFLTALFMGMALHPEH